MNRKTKWRLAVMPFALAGLAIPVVGCEEAGIPNPADDLCCTDFKVGADLTAVDWGVQGSANATFSSFMQATADFAGLATAVVNDVAGACQAIAVDLGAAENAVTATDNAARATAWCELAVTQIQTQVTANGTLEIIAQPPVCEFSASAQASCEAKCTANVECEAELGNVEARCDPAMLSGKCEGQCSAKCEGSANLAITCDGQCEGTCEGDCSAGCNGGGADANCRGTCTGTCAGQCRGSCTMSGGANVACEGSCTGGCDVALKAPRCTAELTPPSAMCQGEAECSGSCQASASAKAECRPPSIEIRATGNISAQAIASLKLNLPKILLVAEARGQALLEAGNAVVTLSGSVVARAPDLSLKAGLCVVPAAAAIAAAVGNIDASVTASASVLGSVGM